MMTSHQDPYSQDGGPVPPSHPPKPAGFDPRPAPTDGTCWDEREEAPLFKGGQGRPAPELGAWEPEWALVVAGLVIGAAVLVYVIARQLIG